MSLEIHLKDRVKFFPGLKKKDLPAVFDSIFVSTVIMSTDNIDFLPSNFSSWQDESNFNYGTIVGERNSVGEGNGIISDIDYGIFYAGTVESAIKVFNGRTNNLYPLYYSEAINPETETNSGYIYYTIYDVQNCIISSGGESKATYQFAVDIWESKIFINDKNTYDKIN
jgi:hypothetical protein